MRTIPRLFANKIKIRSAGDSLGNVLTQTDALGHTWVNRYDAAGRLLTTVNPFEARTVSNVYNAAGYVAAAWDAMGRKTEALYDIKGHATNVAVFVGQASPPVSSTSSSYDAMGRRVRKQISRRDAETQSWKVEKTCHFFYDGWNLIRETVQLNALTPPNALTNYYTWGNDLSGSLQGAGGVGGLLAVTTYSTSNNQPVTCNSSYPLYDHNGNVDRYVSRNGATVAAFQYDAFGNTVAETLTQSGNNAFTHFRFSTKYWDAETGLYYYGYRYYWPVLGRWINKDPIEERGGANVYSFVGNNSQQQYDVLGLFGAGHRSLGDYVIYEGGHDTSDDGRYVTEGSYYYLIKVPWGHSDFAGGDRFDFVKEDTDPWTSPTPWGEPSAHFQELTESENEVEEALKCCERDKFERAMHKGQDWFSHGKKGFVWAPFNLLEPTGNFGFGHFFDTYVFIWRSDPDDDKSAWNDAEKWGLDKSYVARWDEHCPGK